MSDNNDGSARPIACQTITWGEDQRHRFPQVFSQVAAAGYDGVEIGFRHLGDTPPAVLAEMLNLNGLVLAASHIGGNLEDSAQADAERSVLDEVLDYLNALRCDTLMYSGLRFQNESQFEGDLARLDRAAARCRERGVRLLYHNHDWEFADDARVMEAILTRTDPALGLCPDIGWVAKGTKSAASVVPFLERAKARIGMLHFKDFAGPGSAVDTVVLGEGIAPLADAARWMTRSLPDNAWAIAEQDRADLPPEEAAARNERYLRGLFS